MNKRRGRAAGRLSPIVVTGPTEHRRLTGDERREVLIRVALEQFAERGFQATSIDSIVRAAGVTPPVFYDHFGTKRDLYVYLLQRETERLRTFVATAVKDVAAKPPRDRLEVGIAAFFTFAQEQPFTQRMISREEPGDPVIAQAVEEREDAGTEGMLRLFDRPPFDSRPRTEMIVTGQFLRTGLNGVALWWLRHPEVPKEAVVRAAVDFAWQGLRAFHEG